MHLAERERVILECLGERGFATLHELEGRIQASVATIRRDLNRLTEAGMVTRIHGGARLVTNSFRNVGANQAEASNFFGFLFAESLNRNRRQKERIGREAAKLCRAREAVMIAGGSTTLHMCPHLAGMGLQVLTNSLHIVNELLPQSGTRVLVPGGQVFPEQNVVILPVGDDGMSGFYAPKLIMGAAAIGQGGVMHPSVVLASAERRLVERARQIIVLADSSKFESASGHQVCALHEIDVLITDAGISPDHRKMFEDASVEVIVARE